MRYLITIFFCWIPSLLIAQIPFDSKPPYLQYPVIPAFPLSLTDGQVISKNDLSKKNNTIVFVFSVDCDHCKHLTAEILKNISKFKKTQILMITPFKIDQMKPYYDYYKINNYPNVVMASEPTRQIMYFYDLHYFPGLYIYNKRQRFVRGFEGTVKLDSLLYYLK